jgi:hypothetical protein
MPCTQCGLQLGADARFCPRCGQPVAQASAEPVSPYATPAQPYGESSPAGPRPPAPGTWPPPPPYGQEPPPAGPQQLGYGQPPWMQPVPPETTNKLSTAAFICGGAAVLFLPIVLGPAAIVCANRAMKRKETRAGAAMIVAIGGTILGFIFGYYARQHYAIR